MNKMKIELTDMADCRYNAQIWTSADGGKNWYYTGNGKFCKNYEEIAELAKKYNTINEMCTDCAKLGSGCAGSTCQVWTGCIFKIKK